MSKNNKQKTPFDYHQRLRFAMESALESTPEGEFFNSARLKDVDEAIMEIMLFVGIQQGE